MPTRIGIFGIPPRRSRKRSHDSNSYTGWVIRNCGPASSFFLKRPISWSRSSAVGFTPHPTAKRVAAPIEVPARSVPWFMRWMMRISPIASVSNTAVALG